MGDRQNDVMMSKEQLITMLREGKIENWNVWRSKKEGVIDLSGADLAGVELCYIDLHNVDLTNADLTEADLYMSNLSGARLAGATLTSAMWVFCTMSHSQRDLFVAAQDATITFID